MQGPARAGLNRVIVRSPRAAGSADVAPSAASARRSLHAHRSVTTSSRSTWRGQTFTQTGARPRENPIAHERQIRVITATVVIESPTHAGGVVVRGDGTERAFCWSPPAASRVTGCFPRATLKPAKPSKQAAVREVEEEAGVVATVGAPIGRRIPNARGLVRAQFFLMTFVSEGAPRRRPPPAWFTADEAQQALLYEDARMLDRASAAKCA